jgi:hypothetical protein
MTTETVGEAGEQSTEKAGTAASLRAYLPNRRTAGALCTGSGVLVGRWWGWVTDQGVREAGARIGYTGLGGYAAAYIASDYPSIAMPAVVIGWCGAALMHHSPPPRTAAKGRRITLRKRSSAPVDAEPVEDDIEDQAAVDLDVVAALIRDVAGTEHQGAHLDDLVATGELGDWDKATLRSALDEWDVPVTEFKLRFNGRQRVRMGVRLRDLPAGAGEGLQAAPAGAGEGAPGIPAQHPATGPVPAPSAAGAGAAEAPSPRSAPAVAQGAG